tara:strand:+ start:2989 stop:4317 length:1329 start_codon:yes stop_codon:yes gene_type:complete
MSDLFIQNQKNRDRMEKIAFPGPRTTGEAIKIKQPIDRSFSSISDKEEGIELRESVDASSSKYSFFDNVDQLINVFQECGEDITKKFTLYLCGYSLNLENAFPFLQYMMFLEDGTWNFPNIPFLCATNIQEDERGEKAPLDVYFENLCGMHLLNYVEPIDGEKNPMESMFKGYVKSSTLDDTLFVFFDLTNFAIQKTKEKRIMWVTVDELLNARQCLGFEIQKHCPSIFFQEPALYNIYNERNEIITIPSTLYLCQWKDGTFANVYNEFEEDEKDNYGYESIVDERINHPVLGNFFFFSLRPLEYQGSVTRLRRFVGDIREPGYIIQSISNIAIQDSERKYTLSDVIPSVVSYFSHDESSTSKDVQQKGGAETDDSLEESDEKDVNPPKPETEVLENSHKTIEEEEKELMNLDASCIYFHIFENKSKTPFWCIKSSDDFVEI